MTDDELRFRVIGLGVPIFMLGGVVLLAFMFSARLAKDARDLERAAARYEAKTNPHELISLSFPHDESLRLVCRAGAAPAGADSVGDAREFVYYFVCNEPSAHEDEKNAKDR
jgi:hypothetical protein